MARTIAELIAAVRKSDHAGYMPVVFNGREPRIIGWASNYPEADLCAISEGVSATYLSKGTVMLSNGTESDPFFILHG